MNDLEWLTKYWRYTCDGERVGDIFYHEMNGFRYRSAEEIIAMLRDKQTGKEGVCSGGPKSGSSNHR